MAKSLPRLTYTSKDFEEIRSQLVQSIPLITNKWSDFNETDIGITLIELWSAIGDMLSFYLDQQVNEVFLNTARQRKNIINLTKLIAYKLEHIVSSTSIIEFSIQSPHTKRIEIPKYTRVASGGDDVVYFATTSLATIAAGDTKVLVGVKQGIPNSETFNTSGLPSQKIRLTEKLVDLNSIELVIDGLIWQKVDSFVNAQASDRVFIVDVDADYNIDLTLGNGFFGYAPQMSSTNNIIVRYLTSIGSEGNVGTNVITTLISNITDVSGAAVSLEITNPQAATGGADVETIEHAKEQAPAELSTLFRAVTKSDYKALVEGFAGVGKANAWGEQDEGAPDYNLFNWVIIAVAPEGVTREALIDDYVANGKPSDQLKSDILSFLETRKCITTRTKLLDPIYKPINLEVNVYYQKGYLPSVIKSGIEDSLFDFFDFNNISFGKDIRKSNIVKLIDSTLGVDYNELVLLNTVDSENSIEDLIVLNKYEIPFLNSLTINLFKTSDIPIKADVYPCPPTQPAPVD